MIWAREVLGATGDWTRVVAVAALAQSGHSHTYSIKTPAHFISCERAGYYRPSNFYSVLDKNWHYTLFALL